MRVVDYYSPFYPSLPDCQTDPVCSQIQILEIPTTHDPATLSVSVCQIIPRLISNGKPTLFE